MNKRKLISLATLIALNVGTCSSHAAPQDIDIMMNNSNLAITTEATPINSMINWASLCLVGQSLTDSAGCTPDCNRGIAAPTCNTLMRTGQVENLSGIPLPYQRTGVVVFELTQTIGTGTSALFNVTLSQKPSGYGYTCEILNANGTPATLWDTSHPTAPTSIITLDSNVSGPPFKSDSFATTITQPAGSVFYWYNNPNNPLYMMCLGYTATEPNTLQSNTACGGNESICVSYTLQ